MDAAFQSGFASALLDVLFNRMTDFIAVELNKMTGSDAALGKLQTTILHAQKLLNQVDTFELQGNMKKVFQERVDSLTELCYKTEDIIDDISILIDAHHNNLEFCNKPVLKAILPSFRNWSKPRIICKLQNKLDDILKELEALAELTNQPGSRIGQSTSTGHLKPNSETLCLRNNDVEAIVQELISDTSKSHGVSIVGIDGLGKTVIAQTIQNEAKIAAHFSRRLWIDLIGCFNVEHIINQLDELHSNESYSEAPCQGQKSILIIFDNFLEVKLVDWNSFWSHLGTRGISGVRYINVKLLITTFNARVAKNTRTSLHYLNPLSEEKCKELIIATARSHNPNLTDTHFQHAVLLANRSGGLPSVASILGVFLAQDDEDEVRNILNEDLWDSVLFWDEIFPSLKPCYARIQLQLKQCLAYFSLFPLNYAFTIDDLVQLWVGEGFLQVQEPRRISPRTPMYTNAVQTAKDHFTDLLGMSIVRPTDHLTPPDGMLKYELNPFGLKFAQLAASRTCLQLAQGMQAYNINIRHLSYKDIDLPLWIKLEKLRGLRTFMSVFKSNIGKIPPSAFKALTRLRVLSLTQTDVSKLPDSIKCLKRLRYLDISHTRIKSLPESLSELHTLQFLKLVKDKGNLEYLPKAFHKLTNMLYIDWGISDIKCMGLPSNIGHLSSLQTLPLFPVGDEVGHFITELNSMDHLQGSIRISNLDKVQDWARAKRARLCDKSDLQGIELEWMTSANKNIANDVLACLQPHQNLRRLKITNYHGDKFPDWMILSLPKLEEMHLHNCPLIKGLPKLGFLPNLKVLVLEETEAIQNVDHNFLGQGDFPKLESFVFKHMDHLEQVQEWSVGVNSNAMPCLRALKFINCPSLVNVSSLNHLTALVELQIESCGALRSLPDTPISLKSLTIRDSDLLSSRCTEGGEYWPNVDRITKLEIDYEEIKTSGSNSLPMPIDQPETISSDQQNAWRGYQIFKDGTSDIVRWLGSKF
ncbi:putative disease resistance protein RGA3 [Silene latifolia]|uniref:putative disease resistance protein RGA3 n=1 Tax=Silene latifolia TaxID=37657 RepID=UPI003D77FC11